MDINFQLAPDENSQYSKKKALFTQQSVTYLRQILLRRISEDAPFSMQESDSKVAQIAELLLMNPLELAYWELLLHSTSLLERAMPFPYIYIFTAYLSKSSLNVSTALFEQELSRHIRDFKLLFSN